MCRHVHVLPLALHQLLSIFNSTRELQDSPMLVLHALNQVLKVSCYKFYLVISAVLTACMDSMYFMFSILCQAI